MKKTQLLFALLLLAAPGAYAQNCPTDRYLTDIFSTNRTENIDFAQAPAVFYPTYISESATFNQTLRFDIYQPVGDTLSKRPLIIMAFGGAFLVGWKQQPQLVDFCEAMCAKGYVVASIDYRLGFNPLSTNTAIRAVYRGAQDVKAAVRHFKANAAAYNINPDWVFVGGNSAGGISAIHATYVLEADRAATGSLMAPTYGGGLFGSWPDLGCGECSGNPYYFAPYNIEGVASGVINLWGAIGDLSWLNPGDAPIISFHGVDDNLVNPETGPPFDYPLFPALHGSIPIHAQCDAAGITNDLNLIEGWGHEPWVDAGVLDFIVDETSVFLYELMKPGPPAISGPDVACRGMTAQYSVANPNPESRYCWDIVGGTILSESNGGVEVIWGNGTTGQLQLTETNCMLFTGETTLYDVSLLTATPPTGLQATQTSHNEASLIWNAQPIDDYEVRYRPAGTTNADWVSLAVVQNSATVTGLDACTQYEMQVRAGCTGDFTAWTNTSLTTPCINVKAKVCLQGAYNLASQQMGNALRAKNLLPLQQPFNQAPWWYAGNESVSSVPQLPSNAVDWVLLEVRDPLDPETVLAQKAAILLQNGSIADPDPNIPAASGVVVEGLRQVGNYLVAIRHRNHLPVLAAQPTYLPNATAYDFTNNMGKAAGGNQLADMGNGTFAMKAGDFIAEGIVSVADYNGYKTGMSAMNLYSIFDCTLDGTVTVHDFNLYLSNASAIAVNEMRY